MTMSTIDFSQTGLSGEPAQTVAGFIAHVHDIAGDNVRSIALYGSATRSDYAPAHSDVNLMIIVNRLDVPAMNGLLPLMNEGRRDNIRPFFITMKNLTFGAEAFPAKFLSIKEGHVTLVGDDLLTDIVIDKSRLMFRVDQDTKNIIFKLRRHYLVSGGRELTNTMIRSFSTLLETMRIALSLDGHTQLTKNDVITKGAARFDLDESTLREVEQLRDRTVALPRNEAESLYDRFVTVTQTLAENIGRIAEDNG